MKEGEKGGEEKRFIESWRHLRRLGALFAIFRDFQWGNKVVRSTALEWIHATKNADQGKVTLKSKYARPVAYCRTHARHH